MTKDRARKIPAKKGGKKQPSAFAKSLRKHWQLYLFLLVPLLFTLVFKYIPMYGLQIAFKDYNGILGYVDSPWADFGGFAHFKTFFGSYLFKRLLVNTLTLSLYTLIVGFPIPIILAIFLNECLSKRFSKSIQMITYMPYFISTVVLVSMLNQFLSQYGLLNQFLELLGLPAQSLLSTPEMFQSLYVWSGVWQGTGYSAVVYIASLAGVNPELYDACKVDGANTFQKIMHVDLPSIMPTAIIMLILQCGSILNVGFEKAFLMQTPLNMEHSDIISTYVYRIGIESAQFSYSTAINLFNSVVTLILIFIVNKIANRVSDTSLW